jgi:crotonobetainyl-CoA:carnitine CoA-transferase CaiB-like acyl-CoA transferase
MQQMYESDHLRERKYFVQFDQPGMGKLTLPGAPSQYGKIKWALRRQAPLLGAQNEEVFCGEFGVPRERLAKLKQTGVV